MLVAQIICQIDEAIRDKHMPREKRLKIYKILRRHVGRKSFQNMKTQKLFRSLNLLKYRNVGRASVMRLSNTKQNPKFCMSLTGRLLTVIFIG